MSVRLGFGCLILIVAPVNYHSSFLVFIVGKAAHDLSVSSLLLLFSSFVVLLRLVSYLNDDVQMIVQMFEESHLEEAVFFFSSYLFFLSATRPDIYWLTMPKMAFLLVCKPDYIILKF